MFESFWDHFIFYFGLAYVFTIIFIVVLLIYENRGPLKTLSWLLALLFLPIIGIVFYVYFGQSYRKQKIFNRKEIKDFYRLQNMGELQALDLDESEIFNEPAVQSQKHIIKLLLNNSKALLTAKNKMHIFNDGQETFDDICESLQNAKHHIHLEYYIIEEDNIGNRIKNILIEKAKQGIEVRIIYDDVGSWSLSKKFMEELTDSGVEIFGFMPVRFPMLTSKINFRNHRKIIVIDGQTGYLGGMNIADRYIHGNNLVGRWRDTHLRLEGEAVNTMQALFLTDWYFVSKKIIGGQNYILEKTAITEKCLVQIVASGPDSDWASIMQAYFSAIARAEEYVYISTPYFIPNSSILNAIKTGALSGLDIRLLLPGKSDAFFTYHSTLSYIEELLMTGVQVYFYKEGFNHSKLLILDGKFSSVGTANMDERSFDQNFEVNALIYDKKIAEELTRQYLHDLSESERINLEDWLKRNKVSKFLSSFARLFSPLL